MTKEQIKTVFEKAEALLAEVQHSKTPFGEQRKIRNYFSNQERAEVIRFLQDRYDEYIE